MNVPLWMPAAPALALLQVQAQTLYANVSRGRVRVKPDPADPRRSLYHRDDVQRLAGRSRGRRSSAAVAGEAIQWGEPVLASALSTVAQGRLWYRGEDACALAQHASLEAVAALLWQGSAPRFDASVATMPAPAASARPLRASPARSSTSPPALLHALPALALRAATDPPSRGRGAAALRDEAAGVVGTLADALLGTGRALPLHERLARTWRRPAATDALRRALVLLADHELNASTFAARVTASTGASLAACVLCGLATLSGPLHGGAAAAVQALVRDAAVKGSDAALREWLAHDRPLAAFGHPLYPQGDVRCAALLACFELPGDFAALRSAGERLIGEAPNVDFALAAMTAAHRLPAHAPITLFALARSVGWVAHALEQQGSGQAIRPRARYTGPAPGRAQ